MTELSSMTGEDHGGLAQDSETAIPMTSLALELYRLMAQRGFADDDGTALAP